MALSENAKRVPELPRLIVRRPDTTFPVPIAAIILSPPPVDTGIPSGIPYSIETSRSVIPMNLSDFTKGGRYFSSFESGSIAFNRSDDHSRLEMFNIPVPDASPYSITF